MRISVLIGMLGLTSSCHLFNHLSSQKDPMQANRQQKSFVLANGMEVLLISDQRFNKSAAAVDVRVGHLADPSNHKGLAHFLEHMLFMGTKKHPEVGSFDKFIEDHQGSNNAYTSSESTNYQFEVDDEGFDGALDRFAQFFVEPLFDPHFVEREMRAVNSENEKNRENDMWRRLFVVRKLHRDGHPTQLAATGSLETLKEVNRDTLVKFYEDHYSANLMKLSLMSSKSLDDMERMAKLYFDKVPNRDRQPIEVAAPMFSSSDLPRLVQIKPIKNLRQLTLIFEVPYRPETWTSKPLMLLSHLVGHEGEGSLLSHLKRKNLALALSSHFSTDTHGGTFEVDIDLTEKGVAEWQEVSESCFAFLNILRREGLSKLYFEERQKMAQYALDYRDPVQGMQVASYYANRMQTWPALEVDQRAYLYEEFKPEIFQEFLEHLKPELANVLLTHAGAKTSKKEIYYGTEYSVEPLGSSIVKRWQNAKLGPEVHLPTKNPFIPESLHVESSTSSTQPKLIIDNESVRVWFQQDDQFHLPKTNMKVLIRTPHTAGSPENIALSHLYNDAVEESMTEWLYDVSLAGTSVDIHTSEAGIMINIAGYSSKLDQVLAETLKRLRIVTLSAESFDDIKTKYRDTILNGRHDQPYQRIMQELPIVASTNQISEMEVFDPDRNIDLISRVTLADIEKHIARMFGTAAVEAVIFGSVDEREIKSALADFTKKVVAGSFPQSKWFREEIVKIPPGDSLGFTLSGFGNNCAVFVTTQHGPRSHELSATIRLGQSMLEKEFFKSLRSEQQLGYIVAHQPVFRDKVLGVFFLVQSDSYDAFEVRDRIEKWLATAPELIKNADPQRFEMIKEALIRDLLKPKTSFHARTNLLWHEASNLEGMFNYNDKVAEAVKTLTQSGVYEHFKTSLSPKTRSVLTGYLLRKGDKVKPTSDKLIDGKISSFRAQESF